MNWVEMLKEYSKDYEDVVTWAAFSYQAAEVDGPHTNHHGAWCEFLEKELSEKHQDMAKADIDLSAAILATFVTGYVPDRLKYQMPKKAYTNMIECLA